VITAIYGAGRAAQLLLFYVTMKCILALILTLVVGQAAVAQEATISNLESAVAELEITAKGLLSQAKPHMTFLIGTPGEQADERRLRAKVNVPVKNQKKVGQFIDQVMLRGRASVDLLLALKDTPEFKERQEADKDFRPEQKIREIQAKTGVVFFYDEKLETKKTGLFWRSSKGSDRQIRALNPDIYAMKQFQRNYMNDGPEKAREVLLKEVAEVEAGYAAKRKLEPYRMVRRAGSSFFSQYLAFCVSEGILSAASVAAKSNPVALEQAGQSCFSILGALGFMAFMGGNHATQKLLAYSKRLPDFVKSSAGMGVGLLASSVVHEMLEDLFHGDWHLCRTGEPSPERDESCRLAKGRWLSGDKYRSYTPNAVSLLGSFGMTVVTQKLFVHIIGAETAKRLGSAISSFGRRRWVAPGAWGLSVVHFTLFFIWERIFSPPVLSAWGGLNFKHWGFSESESLRDSKGELSHRLRTYKEQLQEEEWFSEQLQEDPSVFLPGASSSCQQPIFMDKRPWFREVRPGDFSKEYETCLRREKIDALVANRFAFQKERTKLITQAFSGKQQNWYALLGDFMESYEITFSFLKQLVQMKQLYQQGKLTDAELEEALSKDYIRGVFERFTRGPKNAKVEKKLLGAKFNHIGDYVLYGLICGPDIPDADGNGTNLTGLDKKKKNPAGAEFVKTPLGSSFEFIPPKVTNTDRDICKYFGGPREKKIYSGEWKDANGKTYDSVGRFLFDNLDPEIVNAQELDVDSEFDWWDSHIDPHIAKVWVSYDEAYKKLIKSQLIPILSGKGYVADHVSFLQRINPFYKKESRTVQYPTFMDNKGGLIEHYRLQLLKNTELLEVMVNSFKALPSEQQIALGDLRELVTQLSNDLRQNVMDWENVENPLEMIDNYEARLKRFTEIFENLRTFLEEGMEQVDVPTSFLKRVVAPDCSENNLQMTLFMLDRFDAATYEQIDFSDTEDLAPDDFAIMAVYPLPMNCSEGDRARALLKERVLPEAALNHLSLMMQEYIGHVESVLELTKPYGL